MIAMLKCKRHFYEHGNHCNRSLARLLRKQRAFTHISYIVVNDGTHYLKSNEIVIALKSTIQLHIILKKTTQLKVLVN